jgi:hypothetical protein
MISCSSWGTTSVSSSPPCGPRRLTSGASIDSLMRAGRAAWMLNVMLLPRGPLNGEDPGDVGAAGDLAVEALQRVGRAQLAVMGGRERVEGEDVLFGLLEHGGDLGQPALELADGVAEPPARLGAVARGEDRADQRAEYVVLVLAGMAAQVVNGSALP